MYPFQLQMKSKQNRGSRSVFILLLVVFLHMVLPSNVDAFAVSGDSAADHSNNQVDSLRWNDLSTDEQQRVLDAYKQWKKMPEEEQRRIRRNLALWQTLSEDEQVQIREIKSRFERLSPRRKNELLFKLKQWRTLSEAKRRRLTTIWRRLQGLSPQVRRRI